MPLVCRRTRDRERGNAIILTMVVLTALATLSGLTVVSVQGGIATTGNDRFYSVARYAAESGAAAAMDALRKKVDQNKGWGDYVAPYNTGTPEQTLAILGNNIGPGQSGSLFSSDTQAWFSVEVRNNRADLGYALGNDEDKQVIIRSTGHGPNGATAIIEWEIKSNVITGTGRPCPTYAQRGMSEDGAGINDCLRSINTSDAATYTPGN